MSKLPHKSGPGRRRPSRRKGRKPGTVRLGAWEGAAIAAVLALLVLIPVFRSRGRNAERGARVPKGDFTYGIDVSHNNPGPILWDSLKVLTDGRGRTVRALPRAIQAHPVSYAFIKATEGVSMRDRDFRDNWKAAGEAGLRRGAYHFFRSSKDGALQADNFIRAVGDIRARDLPPVLDIETVHRGCSKALLNERALQWLRTVEKRYGRKPAVYTGASFAKDWLSPEITGNYEIWIAHYGKDRPAFDGWTWWQFTDKAVVYGVPGRVDLNVRRVEK